MTLRIQIPSYLRGTSIHPVIRDIGLTATTAVMVALSSLFTVSLVGHYMGPQDVAEFLLVRRISAWIFIVALVGLNVAVPRYVAFATNSLVRKRYFWAALACSSAIALATIVVLNIGSSIFSKWLFGASDFQYLVFPLSLFILAQVVHAIVYGYYRGCLAMKRANLLMLANYVVVPVIAVIAFCREGSIPLIVTVTSASMVIVGALMALPLLPSPPANVQEFKSAIGELLRYGAPRVPGDLASGGLFSLAPIIAAHYVPVRDVASMLLGLGMLGVVGTSVNPVNVVLLSKISKVISQGRWEAARQYVSYILSAVPEVSLYVCLQLVIFADVIVRLWVGPKFLGHLMLIRVLVAAIPFYLFFTSMRSAIDAATVKPMNSRNTLIALGVFLAAVGMAVKVCPRPWLLESIGVALLIALVSLAACTARTLHSVYGLHTPWRRLIPGFIIASVLGAVALGIRFLQGWHTGPLVFFSVEIALFIAFIAALKKTGSSWLEFLLGALFRRRSNVADTPVVNYAAD